MTAKKVIYREDGLEVVLRMTRSKNYTHAVIYRRAHLPSAQMAGQPNVECVGRSESLDGARRILRDHACGRSDNERYEIVEVVTE